MALEHDYGDVHMCGSSTNSSPAGNSGFVFRTVPGKRGSSPPAVRRRRWPITSRWNCPTTATRAGSGCRQVNGGSGRDGLALKPKPLESGFPLLAPEWNAAEIELIGQTFRMTLNGEQIQSADLNQLLAAGSRYPASDADAVGMGSERTAKTVRFRNVEVLELPSGP